MRILNTTFWAKQRAKGFRRFVFVTGPLQVALPTLAVGLLFSWWWAGHTGLINELPGYRQRLLRASVLGILVGVPVFGVTWGFLAWKVNEWLYRKYTANGGSAGA